MNGPMVRRFAWVTSIVALTALLDFVTKAAALDLPAGGARLLPNLDLALSFNRGISFGIFHDATGITARVALIVFPICVTAGLLWWAHRTDGGLDRAGFALIAGGALGNVIDRVPDGVVTDFISMHAAGWYFPTYNMADLAITLGLVLLLWSGLQTHMQVRRSQY